MKILSKKPGPKPTANVTQETAVRRLQRHYKRNGMALRKTRPVDVPCLGEWHVVDCGLNAVVKKHVDIAQAAAAAGLPSRRGEPAA